MICLLSDAFPLWFGTVGRCFYGLKEGVRAALQNPVCDSMFVLACYGPLSPGYMIPVSEKKKKATMA